MSTEQQNTRYYGGDSGIPEHLRKPLYDEWTEYRDSITDEIYPQIDDFRVGFVRGAASIDRVEIVREAFKGLLRGLDLWVSPAGKRAIRQRMDAVIAAMEKGKENDK